MKHAAQFPRAVNQYTCQQRQYGIAHRRVRLFLSDDNNPSRTPSPCHRLGGYSVGTLGGIWVGCHAIQCPRRCFAGLIRASGSRTGALQRHAARHDKHRIRRGTRDESRRWTKRTFHSQKQTNFNRLVPQSVRYSKRTFKVFHALYLFQFSNWDCKITAFLRYMQIICAFF